MPFTAGPTPPSTSDPSTFSSRMTAWVAWLVGTFVPELTAAMLGYGPGAPFATYGGTADAITLTSNLNLGSLVAGQRVAFQATAANTGAATINLDGLGAVSCVTVTGAALPFGYIRTGVWTFAWYNGTAWVVDRLPEAGSNASGRYTKFADGTMICVQEIGVALASSTASGSIFTSGAEATWTFPAAFLSTGGLAVGGTFRSAAHMWLRVRTSAATTAEYRAFSAVSIATAQSVELFAIGRWY